MSGAAAILRVLIVEGPDSQPFSAAERLTMFRALLDKGYFVSSVQSVPCSANSDDALTVVLGRFSRGRIPYDDAAQYIDMTGHAVDEVAALVETAREKGNVPAPGRWKPWFPVIDYSRCTNCMQCLSFCLFDVYGVSQDGKIRVQNQNNCKTDCPACSRVCPEVAILFPKYRHGPIHGGEINTDDVRREAMKVDISALLGGDIYSALRDRSARAKSRFSKERDEDRALKERLNCLNKLQQQMDIPAEVLAALPGVEEIRSRAEAAKVRAQSALGQAQSE